MYQYITLYRSLGGLLDVKTTRVPKCRMPSSSLRVEGESVVHPWGIPPRHGGSRPGMGDPDMPP